jgi:hypothetical protein
MSVRLLDLQGPYRPLRDELRAAVTRAGDSPDAIVAPLH